MHILRVLVCGSLCAAALSFGPRQALAQQPVATLILEARRQLDELNPDSAGGILVRVLDPSARASRSERVRALVLLGIAELMLSDPGSARLNFQQALALEPQLRVDSLADLQTFLLTTFDAARLSAAPGAEPRPAILTRDNDNDGVTNDLDRCADTPVNARPVHPAGHAQAGCPVDSDADGVVDYLDRCANTAAGTQVDANGCPVRRDTDRDGVIDANDRCPNTPAASRVDANGCPLAGPAAQPQSRLEAITGVHREGSIELTVGLGLFAIDRAFAGTLFRIRVVTEPSRFMLGGELRGTYNLSQNLGLGVGTTIGTGNGAILLGQIAAVTYTLDLNKKLSPFFELGAGMNRFSGSSANVKSNYSVFGGVGVRSMMADNVALRVEVRMAYDKYSAQSSAAYSGGAFGGFSLFMGGGPPRASRR